MIRLLSLLLSLGLSLTLSAQVGVNNPNPEQALDVEGKVKVGDDMTVPTDGTIRYNDIESDFEGFANGQWASLTKSGPVGTVPIPAVVQFWSVAPGSNVVAPNRIETYGNNSIPSVGNFSSIQSTWTVPTGYTFVATAAYLVPRVFTGDQTQDGAWEASFALRIGGSALLQFPQTTVSGTRLGGMQMIDGGRAPLLIVPEGSGFGAINDNNSGCDVRVILHGVFVTDLEAYFSR